ncbi:ankyrin repeat-containing domain protein [Truncatella angustata]|uniref:Ankyrin repeat-containing domain protein n=1 Tax=Truncatella angustata TaxID=152316 RepID=A0A9P8U8J2_9PEZI|nr:ankyrin repeat-containing domain protein [Truncatella angustata]KAH6645259.1 ankyrin repeat-containing domain protein [Truncatella angustata]
MTPVSIAVSHISSDAVIFLVAQGADVNKPDNIRRFPSSQGGQDQDASAVSAGDRPLHAICGGGDCMLYQRAAVGLLLAHGADVNALGCNSLTPLHKLCQEDYRRVTGARGLGQRLQQLWANTTTPLHLACWQFRGGIHMETLLSHGADWRVFDATGVTPIHVFFRFNSLALKQGIEIFLKHGVDLGIQDLDGETPLHVLCQLEYFVEVEDCTGLLASSGVNISQGDRDGRTPLHYLCQDRPSEWREGAIKTLLEHGADVKARGVDGCDPRDVVRKLTKRDDVRTTRQIRGWQRILFMFDRACAKAAMRNTIFRLAGLAITPKTHENA